jgi:hypothetical protein
MSNIDPGKQKFKYTTKTVRKLKGIGEGDV